MKIGLIPENIFERLALATGVVPTPLVESWFPFMLARTIMVATKLGIFEAIAAAPLETGEIAKRCDTNLRATEKLLNSLVGLELVHAENARYALAPRTRQWLLQNSAESARDKILFQLTEWDRWMRCEDFVRTGKPIRMHAEMSDEQWQTYQRGMRSGIEPMVKEVVRRLRLSQSPRAMLDIGGSHGFWSVSFCRRYPELRATILDLDIAIKYAAPILAKEKWALAPATR